jgi:hypothetical protein
MTGRMMEGATKMAQDGSVERVHVTVTLSHLAFDGLMAAEAGSEVQSSVRVESALRCYLGDKGADRPAWPFPSFLRAAETQGDRGVELDVDERLWRDFEAEASAQEISVDQLAEHAAFYFAAEANAGRLTERILEDLASGSGDEQD